MKSATIVYIFFAFIGILGYNAFLAARDVQLLHNAETIKQQYCAHQAPKNHPDCVVE